MPALEEDFITKYMGQDELLTTIGWSSVKGFITSIILVAAFVKLMELIGNYGYGILGHFLLFFGFTLGVYYYNFWNEPVNPDYPNGVVFRKSKARPLTWKDFFYTTEIGEDFSNGSALIVSWLTGLGIYGGLALLIEIIKYCFDNSDSEITMSIVRIVLIGLIATAVYIYGQRYELRKKFWETIALCFIYGFALSISMYLLGMVIGFGNMVLGLPLMVAILILQFGFTSIYTYMDLLEWSRHTHKRLVQDEEYDRQIAEKKKKEEDAAKLFEEEELKKLEEQYKPES